MAADGGPRRRRVFVEDARRNGQYLRVTWHSDHQQFVVSNWDDNVCVGATRVPLDGVPELVSLLVDGLAEAATPTAPPARALTLREHLAAWWHERRRPPSVLPLARTTPQDDRRSA